MSTSSYTLHYDGQDFLLSSADYDRLKRLYDSGLSVSSLLFHFTPVGNADVVTIAVGSGAQFVIKQHVEA